MFMAGGKRYGIEYKYADAPSRSRLMLSAIQDLKLEHLWVIYPQGPEYALDQNITAIPLKSVPGLVEHVTRRRR